MWRNEMDRTASQQNLLQLLRNHSIGDWDLAQAIPNLTLTGAVAVLSGERQLTEEERLTLAGCRSYSFTDTEKQIIVTAE